MTNKSEQTAREISSGDMAYFADDEVPSTETQIFRFNNKAQQHLPPCVITTSSFGYVFAGEEATARNVRNLADAFARAGWERLSTTNLEWCKKVYACTTLPGTPAPTEAILREAKASLEELISAYYLNTNAG